MLAILYPSRPELHSAGVPRRSKPEVSEMPAFAGMTANKKARPRSGFLNPYLNRHQSPVKIITSTDATKAAETIRNSQGFSMMEDLAEAVDSAG